MTETRYTDEQFKDWLQALDCALGAAREERHNQLKKWGFQQHSMPDWLCILSEEVGELAKVVNECETEEFDTREEAKAAHEAIQIAAVALAIYQSIHEGEA